MARRLRREFHALESKIEYGVQDRAWRALIDKVLYDKGDGPESIQDQLRLRARLRRLHGRRNRYNQKRRNQRYQALIRRLEPRHIIAGFAIGAGIVDASEGMIPRDLLIGAMAGDRRLTRKCFEELETAYETVFPSFRAWESMPFWIEHFRVARPFARAERQEFEQMLKPTPLPEEPIAQIPYGFHLTQTTQTHAPAEHARPPAARAAS